MGNTVYRIEDLRARVAALLRKQKAALTLETMAEKLELPMYAVAAGLEAAALAELVEYSEGQGWWIKAGVAA